MSPKHFLAVLAAWTVSSFSLLALPLGNPLDATLLTEGVLWEGNDYENSCLWCDSWSVRIGYYGDFVFNRCLEVDRHQHDANIRKTWITTNAGYVALNMWDQYDLFLTLGHSKFHIKTSGSAFSLQGGGLSFDDTVEVDTRCSFSWSVGLRAALWECGKLGLGAEAQYFHSRPRLDAIESSLFNVTYFGRRARTNYREFQVGLGATYQIILTECKTFLVPYLGATWSHARFHLDDYVIIISSLLGPLTATIFNLDNRHEFGGVIGITFIGRDRWSLTAEGRFANELALHINSQLRF